MATSDDSGASVAAELARRHKSTRTTVLSLLVAVVLLCVLAYLSQSRLVQRPNASVHMAVLITIVIFGFGAIAFRRTKFASMRLQDIAALKGPTGLLISLQRTTLLVALIGVAIAITGFLATVYMGDPSYMYRAGVVAAGVLLYCYPVRASWEQAIERFAPSSKLANP